MSTHAERAAVGLEKPTTSEPSTASDVRSVVVTTSSTFSASEGVTIPRSARASRLKNEAVSKSAHTSKRESAGSLNPPANQTPSSRWCPDVYVHSFVPRAFVVINTSPATPITTPLVDGIDFERYLSTFYGSSFRTPLPAAVSPVWNCQKSVGSLGQLDSVNYEAYFQHSLNLDLEGQIHEIRSFDLFGAVVVCRNPREMLFTLSVPGLRENSPMVNYGDDVMLRQWVEHSVGVPDLGLYGWYPHGQDRPGFTGFVIRAVVVGVDKVAETLHLRASGLIGLPPIKCNVTFVRQARTTMSLVSAVTDIARELQEDNTTKQHDSRPQGAFLNWARHMLFPRHEDGIVQDGLPSANFPQNWFDSTLNYEQMKAVDAVTTTNYGRLCYLINGPPGTGKTKTICEIVAQLGKHPDLPGSMLLCAPSNQAADTLAQRLSKHFRPSEMLRLNHFSRTFAEVPIDLMLYCFVDRDIFNLPPIADLMAYKIVITTCQDADVLVQARVSNRDIFNLQHRMSTTLLPHSEPHLPSTPLHWSALIIDEAAQATEPDTLIPLSVVTPPSHTPHGTIQPIFVMAGDQHQLGPRTYDKSTSLHVSLFERLSKGPVYASHPLARRSMRSNPQTGPMLRPPFTNLIRNYRSHPAILAVPSSLFYTNTLIPEATNTDTVSHHWPSWSVSPHRWPVQFRCNGGIDDCESIRNSTTTHHGWYNVSEAHQAITCAQDLLSTTTIAQPDICIMSPFRAQVRLLRRLARDRACHAVNIGPMEAFQGLESRFVILCTTRARTRFLPDDRVRGAGVVGEPRRFNVALTRAKEGLVVIGSPCVLATDPCWAAFLGFCWRNGLWVRDEVVRRPQHARMGDVDVEAGGKVNEWTPAEGGGPGEGVGAEPSGLEAALLFKEREQWRGSRAAKRFLGRREDELWSSGMEAEDVVRGLDEMDLMNGDGGYDAEQDGGGEKEEEKGSGNDEI